MFKSRAGRTGATVAFAASVVFAGQLAGAGPASAAPRSPDCGSVDYGHLCLYDDAPVFKTMDLYHCGVYPLNNWTGGGHYDNNQTPGTVTKFLDQNRNVIWTSTAPDHQNLYIDWDPVWYVQPC